MTSGPPLVKDGMLLDLSQQTDRPVEWMGEQRDLDTTGAMYAAKTEDGGTVVAFPWVATRAHHGRGVRLKQLVDHAFYMGSDETYLYAVCVSPYADVIIAVFGDDHDTSRRLAPLMERYLPDTFALLNEGLNFANGYGLMRVRTGAGDHWVVAGALETIVPNQVMLDPERCKIILQMAAAVLDEAINFPENVPGFVDVIAEGGPWMRRARAFKKAVDVIQFADDLANLIPTIFP